MQMVAQSWLVYRLTGSSLLLGSIGFVSQFPLFVFSALGGSIADRHNRYRIVIATQTASMLLAFVLAALTLAGRIQVWHMFVLSALLGLVNAFDVPARQTLFMDMVGREDLMNAIALNSSMFNGARIVGPAIAGVLVASIGEGWCFLANAVSYIAVIIGLLMIKLTIKPKIIEGSPLEHMIEGFRYARRTRPIRALLLLIALASLVAMPYSVLMPIFADRILHAGARGLGILMGFSGLGALCGSLLLASRSQLKGLGRIVALSSGGFGIGLVLFAFSKWFWLSAALLLPVGFCVMVQMGATNTLLQSMAPDRLRGRIISLYSMMLLGMAPFGAFFAGALTDRLGAPITVGTGAVACVAGSIWFYAQLPAFRYEARQLVIAQQVAAGDPVEEMAGPPPDLR